MLACAGVLLATPASAPAVTTCAYGGGLLDVQLPASGDHARLSVSGAGEIQVADANASVVCTGVEPPSVSNTNVISVVNGTNTVGNHVEMFAPGRFAPGANALGENGGTPEIEVSVNLNDGTDSELIVGGETIGVPIRLGTSGINPNATPQEVQPDADIFPTGVGDLFGISDGVVGGTVSAEGGAGTGGPLTESITLQGGLGVDLLAGGEGRDTLRGADGSDTLLGKGGNDSFFPGDDAAGDSVDGGPGTDMVAFQSPAGVTVDLALAGPQNTGGSGTDSLAGVENVFGTTFADVLRGDGASNSLIGVQGDDVLDGRGGVDTLDAGPGADSLFVRDGGPDSADCGTEADEVTADAAGVDSLIACESVLFAVLPAPPPPAGGGGTGTGDGARATAGRCAGKRATITATNASQTITGTSRKDVIDALGGNDRVKSLGGNDIVCGGSGRDRLDGGRGNDSVSGGSGNDRLSGASGNDRLTGGSGNDRLSGGSGKDRLLGDSGRDRLFGGASRDVLRGGPGKDTQRP